MLQMKPEERNYEWLKRELNIACDLYDTLLDEIDETGDNEMGECLPSPLEYCTSPDMYGNFWNKFKQHKINTFKDKHKDTLKLIDQQIEESFKKLQMNDDEKIEYYVEKDQQLQNLSKEELQKLEIPQEYYDDLKHLRGFFNTTIATYMGLLAKIIDLIVNEYYYFDISLDGNEPNLINHIEPFGNLVLYQQHRDSDECEGDGICSCDTATKFINSF